MQRKNPLIFNYSNLSKFLHIIIPKIRSQTNTDNIYYEVLDSVLAYFEICKAYFRYLTWIDEEHQPKEICNNPTEVSFYFRPILDDFIHKYLTLRYKNKYNDQIAARKFKDYNPTIAGILDLSDRNRLRLVARFWLSVDPAAFGITHHGPINEQDAIIALEVAKIFPGFERRRTKYQWQ